MYKVKNISLSTIRLVTIENYGFITLAPNSEIEILDIYDIDNLEGLLDPSKSLILLYEI